MKLKNKKTGDICEVLGDSISVNVLRNREDITGYYSSLAELNEEWEDYEEPKEHWYIDRDGKLMVSIDEEGWKTSISIGNYFETKEEAEKAVEKLKAWKRLKDKGFKFVGWEDTNNDVNDILFELPYMEWDKNVSDDLDSLFGGEQ